MEKKKSHKESFFVKGNAIIFGDSFFSFLLFSCVLSSKFLCRVYLGAESKRVLSYFSKRVLSLWKLRVERSCPVVVATRSFGDE